MEDNLRKRSSGEAVSCNKAPELVKANAVMTFNSLGQKIEVDEALHDLLLIYLAHGIQL